MANDTTFLLDLDGVSVVRVERLGDGSRRVHLVTADEAARACPACGVFASRVKGTAVTRPRDLPYGESRLQFLWHKRRWYCREAGCSHRSFTEQIPQIPAGARLTTRLRGAAGRRIRDAGSTVIQAARDLHLSWPTVMDAFRVQTREVTAQPLPEVGPGHRRDPAGKTKWAQDPVTGTCQLVRDRWHTGFVDALGTGRLDRSPDTREEGHLQHHSEGQGGCEPIRSPRIMTRRICNCTVLSAQPTMRVHHQVPYCATHFVFLIHIS